MVKKIKSTETPVRRGQGKSKASRFWFYLRFFLVLLVLAGGALLLLDAWVYAKFSGKKWALPAKVYARPLELFEGKRASVPSVVSELEALGYRPGSVAKAGGYIVEGNSLTVHSRGFGFSDGDEPARRFTLLIERGVVQWMNVQWPEPSAIIRLEPLQIGGIYPAHNEDRLLIQLDDAPERLVAALVAVEDRDFYQHFGISLKGIARAMLANARAGKVEQGGSTLTQQLVKNFFLSNERSLQRKLSEALVSILLELHFSKQEILETYLNEVYLGQSGPRAIHGFGLASRYYFNVSLDQLKLHQQALLVGLVKGPSYYDPWRFPQRSLDRRNLVLDMMLEQGLVSASEAAKAKQAPISVGEKVSRHRATYPAYLDLVRRQLRREYRERDLSSDGLSIFTHFDPLLQWQAERSTAATFARLQQRYGKDRVDPIEAGMIVTSIDSGDVQAVIGGKDIRFPGFNRAIDALRPVGSLMKPAVYLTALSHPDRYSLMTPLSDASVTVKGQDGSVWQPRNFDKKDHGNVPLHRAMSQSLNQATARLGMELGIDAVLDTVKKLGVERSLPEVPSVVLGAAEMTVFDVAGMFQTIAGGGFHSRLNTIHEVLDAKGVALSRYPLEVEQRISPKANYLLQYILQEVMREGTGKKVYRHFPEQYALAGKTGTSDDLRDSWFAGFNGEQLAVVWMGRDDNGSTPVTGASGALLLWQDYFLSQPQESVLQRVPDGVTYHWVDGERMLLSKSHCEGARYMPFIDGTEPSAIAECQSRATDLWQWFRSLLD